MVIVDVVVNFPKTFHLDLTIRDAQGVGGQQFLNIPEKRLPGQTELKRQIVLETIQVCFDFSDEGQEGFHLGSKIQHLIDNCVIKRLDAEPVTGTEQGPRGFVPEHECKHPAQMLDTLPTPFPVGKKDHFGVGGRDEVADPQFLTQLDVIVDLAIENDPVPGTVRHRLPAGIFQVDDAQAPVRKANTVLGMAPGPLPIRTPVAKQMVHDCQLAVKPGDGA